MRELPFDRAAFVAAALGHASLDLVLRDVRFVNVFTGEVYRADIGVSQGRIAHVSPLEQGRLVGATTLERSGLWAVPGLIDTHVHIESSMITPAHYARVVVPRGTTTVLIDPHELANVVGLPGVRYMLDTSEDVVLRVLVMAPSCVPSAPGVETAGASFDLKEIECMLSWPRVVGLAEVMDYPGVLAGEGRMMRLIEATDQRGGLIQGHAPLVYGRALSAYAGVGIQSDHETQRTDEALEKLRAGMVLELRESSLSLNAAATAAALRGRGYLLNVTLCTDDVTAEDLLRQGHIDHVARRLVEEGLKPVDVVRFATINAALHLRRSDLGALAPGRIADIVLLSDLELFTVEEVYRAGSLVARGGEPLFELPEIGPRHDLESRNSVVLPAALDERAFRLSLNASVEDASVRVRVIDYRPDGSPRTVWGELELTLVDGEPDLPQSDHEASINLLAVVDRHDVHGRTTCALVRGFGLRRGALASTVSHDCHQLTVLGCNEADMLAACRALERLRGGIVLVLDGELVAAIPLPVAGLLSREPAVRVAEQVRAFRERVVEAGLPPDNAFMGIVSLTLAVSPEAKLSDLGLVDVERQELLPLVLHG